MNNCQVTLFEGTSKKGNYFACLNFEINGKKIGSLFIKDTEVPYFKDLLKK